MRLLYHDGKFDDPHQTALGALRADAVLVMVIPEAKGEEGRGDDASLVDSGCLALARPVGGHPANQTAAVSAGGIEAVAAAMRVHPGTRDVQNWDCRALGNLVIGVATRWANWYSATPPTRLRWQRRVALRRWQRRQGRTQARRDCRSGAATHLTNWYTATPSTRP